MPLSRLVKNLCQNWLWESAAFRKSLFLCHKAVTDHLRFDFKSIKLDVFPLNNEKIKNIRCNICKDYLQKGDFLTVEGGVVNVLKFGTYADFSTVGGYIFCQNI